MVKIFGVKPAIGLILESVFIRKKCAFIRSIYFSKISTEVLGILENKITTL